MNINSTKCVAGIVLPGTMVLSVAMLSADTMKCGLV